VLGERLLKQLQALRHRTKTNQYLCMKNWRNWFLTETNSVRKLFKANSIRKLCSKPTEINKLTDKLKHLTRWTWWWAHALYHAIIPMTSIMPIFIVKLSENTAVPATCEHKIFLILRHNENYEYASARQLFDTKKIRSKYGNSFWNFTDTYLN